MSSCHARVYVLRFLILTYMATVGVGSALAQSGKGSALKGVKIGSFQVIRADMEQALAALKRTAPPTMLVGFEKAHGDRSDISLELKGTTVGEVLGSLCKSDPRYRYEFISDSLINVFPSKAKEDASDLLNIRVKHTVIDERRTPADVIRRIPDFAPELSTYLEGKAREHAKSSGIAYGTIGARTSGDMDPQMSLDFRNMTVREILNGISLYTLELSRQHSYLTPVSWKYEFVVDPNASTGLGGYPRWEIF